MKKCTKCLEDKPLDQFQRAKGYKDGYQTWCKSCKYLYTRKWLKENPEREDRARQAQADWYAEKGVEYFQNWRNSNRDKTKEYQRRYVEENKEKRRESYRRRREQIRGHETDITTEWLQNLRSITIHCELCGVELTDNNQHDYSFADLDHILPLNAGGLHITSNVRYICHLCNLQRPRDGSDYLFFDINEEFNS